MSGEAAVPGDEVEAGPEDARWRRHEGVDEPIQVAPGAVRHVVGLGHGQAGEAAQMPVGFPVEPEGPSERVDDRDGGRDGSGLFEPRVPRKPDSREMSDFLSGVEKTISY